MGERIERKKKKKGGERESEEGRESVERERMLGKKEKGRE